jgi:hypothetical protein
LLKKEWEIFAHFFDLKFTQKRWETFWKIVLAQDYVL